MQKDDYTNSELLLSVGDGHKLYVQDWGNKNAKIPIIYLHGGPGSSVKDKYKSLFDPKKHRVIFFDQRGCGQSVPLGSIVSNSTDKSILDITKIADKLGVDKFYLHGTSWGSTLALAYAVSNPLRVSALIIGGIFLGTKKEIDWLSQGRFKVFYPDAWDTYLERTPKQYRDYPSDYHLDKVINGTANEQKLSGYAYQCLEAGIMRLDDRFTPESIDDFDPSGIKMEMYYMQNKCFMPDGYILDNANKLTMPVYIVQGRYDMVCTPNVAYVLSKKLINCQLYWTISNHAGEHEDYNVFKTIFANL